MKVDLRLIPIFSLAFMIGYQIDDYVNQPLIKYYPNIGAWSWGWVKVPTGHNTIGWFGWICWGLITALIVITLGGLGSLTGSMAGGLLLGLVETFGVYFTDPSLKILLSFAVFVLVLLFRPRVLFAR